MTQRSKLVRRERCPECEKQGRDTHEDNLGIFDDGHAYCFSCAYHRNSQGAETLVDYTFEYLPWRGILADTFRAYECLTKIDVSGRPVSIAFRYPGGDIKIRTIDSKEFYWQKVNDTIPPGLFGRDRFAAGSHKHVIVTEGEIDALTIRQVLHDRSPAVSIQSSSTAVRDCTVDYDWLNSFERVYLAFDNDASGREALKGVAKLFDPNRVFVLKFTNRKDPNEYLQHGEEEELRSIWKNAKRYQPETIVSSFSEFRKILESKPKEGVPYPFPTLNKMTYGIRTGETVLITALEGVGKTEIMHTILYQLLRETDANVGAIFIEEDKARLLQAIGGIHLRKPVHLPDSGVTAPEIADAVEAAVKTDDRLHVYTHFGSDDPDVLLDNARFMASAGNCRYILFDHIGMAVSGSPTEDERRTLDYLMTKFEMQAKELGYGLIIVSHVNDDGLTRGSRYISKIAGIRIDAFRNVAANDNITYLTISKNRFSGKTGPAGQLEFDPITYTLSEAA